MTKIPSLKRRMFVFSKVKRKNQLKNGEEYSIIKDNSLYIIQTILPRKMKGVLYEETIWQVP